MAHKKTPANKASKAKPATKKTTAPKPTAIDWAEMPLSVTIIGVGGKHLTPGKEYTISKETAKILVEKGVAKVK